MHGAGNVFVCLDGVTDPALARRDDLPRLAVAMSNDRQGVRDEGGAGDAGGVGADGLILICRPDPALATQARRAVRMRMFNTDGTESPMCGNGIRCVAKYALEHGLVDCDREHTLIVQTGAGPVEATCRLGPAAAGVEAVTVDMGVPRLDLTDVPVDGRRLGGGRGPERRLRTDAGDYEAVFVSMGNPHATIYVDDVAGVDVARVGPKLETHPAFPQRMNVHFVEPAGREEVVMRTWERGSGITGACGSGACAVCVAGVLTGRTGRRLLAHLPGGDLELRWDHRTNRVFMTGPVVEEFSGRWR
jgi:diaminopimelate epimerase